MAKINETNYPRRTQANYEDTDMLILQKAGGNTFTTRLSDMREDSQRNLAPIEGSTASRNYAVGEQLVYNGILYKVTQAINAGASLNVGTNITRSVIADELATLNSNLTNLSSWNPDNITSRLTDLPRAIAEQNLEKYGYKIGQYFTGASGYTYWLADKDPFYSGYNYYAVLGTHHLGLVVDTKTNTKWHDSVVAYKDSTLHSLLTTTVLNNIKSDLTALFGNWANHLLSHDKLYNARGTWAWSSSNTRSEYISALTESQIYGAPIWSEDTYQQGEGDKKLEIFNIFKYNRLFGNVSLWLRSIASSSWACSADNNGYAGNYTVTYGNRAVGLILFY